jgi:hypothetical protein
MPRVMRRLAVYGLWALLVPDGSWHIARLPSRFDTVGAAPSTTLAIDWLSHLGHGRSGAGFALLLAAVLLAVVGFALRSPHRPTARMRWPRALAAAVALVALDIGARVACGPTFPRFTLGDGLIDVSLGGAELHRHVSMWGDEGPAVELLLGLAVVCAGVVAVRRSSRILMFAAALTLLGTVTNLAEVALRAYDTDYLWFGNAFLMTPFNLGDVYEFGGGVLMACCCLRAILAAPAQVPAA